MKVRKTLRQIGWGVLGVIGIVLGTAWLRELAALDPFAHLRRSPASLGRHMAIQLSGVQLKSYERGLLRATANIERLNVRRSPRHM